MLITGRTNPCPPCTLVLRGAVEVPGAPPKPMSGQHLSRPEVLVGVRELASGDPGDCRPFGRHRLSDIPTRLFLREFKR